MKIRCERKHWIFTAVVMILTTACLLVTKGSVIILACALAAEALTCVLYIDFGKVINGLLNILYMFGASFVIYDLSQRIILEPTSRTPARDKDVLNVLLLFVLILLIHAITRRAQLAIGLVGIIVFALSTANFYVWNFRKTQLTPPDLLGWQTAQNVASSYHYLHNQQVFYAVIALIIMLMAGSCLKKAQGKWISRLVSLVLFCVLGIVLNEGAKDISPAMWNRRGAQDVGYVLNFALQIRDSKVEAPASYTKETLEQLNESYPKVENTSKDGPTIIAIMNESLADFSIFGELPSGEDPLPYLHSLQENTISGYALSSVFGGLTAISEYEFLTGNSQAFLPEGSIAYMQYINSHTYSLVDALQEANYNCIAMHPYKERGWRRRAVYENFGFDSFYTDKDFKGAEKIRRFVTDAAMYDKIIELYENKGDQPMFLFGVTMQNHGSYDYTGKRFDYDSATNTYGTGMDDVEQYLYLAHMSDQAFKKLVDYFSEEEEDVVILMFGDHLPGVDTDLFSKLYGSELETLDERMLQYTVPFWVWTNYDIEEQTDVQTSINYLSNYMLETAGMELPAYNQFLSDIEETIPVINGTSYYSLADSIFKELKEAEGEEAEALELYHAAAYNLLFGKESDKLSMFQLSEQAE